MRVYKIGEKQFTGTTLVYIKTRPDENLHQVLQTLSTKTDLALVFPKDFQKTVSVDKLSHLYGACWYGLGDGNDEAKEVWDVLDYLHELGGYYSFSILLGLPNEEQIKAIEKLQTSPIETSVFKKRRLRLEEIERIYEKKKTFWGYRDTGLSGMYSRWKTDDEVVFLRPYSIAKIKENPFILSTFFGSSLATMIPSMIHDNLNTKIDELKV